MKINFQLHQGENCRFVSVKTNYLIAALLLLFFTSCRKQNPHSYTFYYWKTTLQLDSTEKSALQDAKVPELYTRFFDVDKTNGKFQPIGIITKDSTFITDKKIVPVVFITNKSFLNIQPKEISFLAKSISDLIERKSKELNLQTTNEIQIDCDWTAGTKKDYFAFLQELKEISNKNITSTLRLHQVKDKGEMGIPPVDKVYLMCYSTSSPLENSDKNSILDLPLLKTYLRRLDDYPIKKMAVALPIYSWAIVSNHVGKHRLINGVSEKDLQNPNFRRISKNHVEVRKDGFYFGHFLNKGFTIKVEQIEDDQLDEAVHFINRKREDYSIVYYQLDHKFIENHNLTR